MSRHGNKYRRSNWHTSVGNFDERRNFSRVERGETFCGRIRIGKLILRENNGRRASSPPHRTHENAFLNTWEISETGLSERKAREGRARPSRKCFCRRKVLKSNYGKDYFMTIRAHVTPGKFIRFAKLRITLMARPCCGRSCFGRYFASKSWRHEEKQTAPMAIMLNPVIDEVWYYAHVDVVFKLCGA